MIWSDTYHHYKCIIYIHVYMQVNSETCGNTEQKAKQNKKKQINYTTPFKAWVLDTFLQCVDLVTFCCIINYTASFKVNQRSLNCILPLSIFILHLTFIDLYLAFYRYLSLSCILPLSIFILHLTFIYLYLAFYLYLSLYFILPLSILILHLTFIFLYLAFYLYLSLSCILPLSIFILHLTFIYLYLASYLYLSLSCILP